MKNHRISKKYHSCKKFQELQKNRKIAIKSIKDKKIGKKPGKKFKKIMKNQKIDKKLKTRKNILKSQKYKRS